MEGRADGLRGFAPEGLRNPSALLGSLRPGNFDGGRFDSVDVLSMAGRGARVGCADGLRGQKQCFFAFGRCWGNGGCVSAGM